MFVCAFNIHIYTSDYLPAAVYITYAFSFLQMTAFCDADFFPHEPDQPTMHNALCSQRPTFDVILDHVDFENGQ